MLSRGERLSFYTLGLLFQFVLVSHIWDEDVKEIGKSQASPKNNGQVNGQRRHAVRPTALTNPVGWSARGFFQVCSNECDEEERCVGVDELKDEHLDNKRILVHRVCAMVLIIGELDGDCLRTMWI